MNRLLICGCLSLCVQAGAAQLPAWWTGFPSLPRLESAFVQESESAVFGKLTRHGQLRLARGGRLRVDYQGGLVLVADGRSLVQYDPQARTAQKQDLGSAVVDAPMLNVLLNPRTLSTYYRAEAGADGTLTLEPRRPSLPKVELTGRGALIRSIQWTDATGARQRIEFQDPKVPAGFDPGVFRFQAPAGTRWLGAGR